MVERGGRVGDLRAFLVRAAGELPPAGETFPADLEHKADQLANGGLVRPIEYAGEYAAAELASDRSLKGKCLHAGGAVRGRSRV